MQCIVIYYMILYDDQTCCWRTQHRVSTVFLCVVIKAPMTTASRINSVIVIIIIIIIICSRQWHVSATAASTNRNWSAVSSQASWWWPLLRGDCSDGARWAYATVSDYWSTLIHRAWQLQPFLSLSVILTRIGPNSTWTKPSTTRVRTRTRPTRTCNITFTVTDNWN